MRSAEEAASYARYRANSGEVMAAAGYCLQFTRENYPTDPLYFSAVDAAQASEYPHPAGTSDGDHPPLGVPVYFVSSNPYRHVGLYVGNGEVATVWDEEIRLVAFSAMPNTFGPYAGWAEDLNGIRVWTPDTPSLEEDTMRMIQRGSANGTVALLDGGGTYLVLGKYAIQHWTDTLGTAPRVVTQESYDGTLACLAERRLP